MNLTPGALRGGTKLQADQNAGSETRSWGQRHRLARTLYVSYDGVLEPLGESQVVSYIERLSIDYDISLLSFEKAEDLRDRDRLTTMRARLERVGIAWTPLRYHKRPAVLSTAFDVLKGWAYSLGWSLRGSANLVHARGYVPALICLMLKKVRGVPLLFDMRGFWVDEKVEAGHWTRGSLLYRTAKRFERRFFESADGVISLTSEGLKALSCLGYGLRRNLPMEVIPTCTDLDRFAPGPKDSSLVSALGLSGRLVIGCTGTMSSWYLRQSMLRGLAFLARNLGKVSVLLVTREDHERLRVEAVQTGLAEDQLVLTQTPFGAMPAYTRLMDLGLFFIKPCFAKHGSAATKLGEFLASGVPVVINDGVGDSGHIVRSFRAGVVLNGAEQHALQAALPTIQDILCDPQTPQRCREAAQQHFNLAEGVRRYHAIYAILSRVRDPERAPVTAAA